MKKLILPIILILFLLTACTKTEPNITFKAVIESVYNNGIIVTTADDVGFSKANVEYDNSLEIPLNLTAGQTVELTILPQIRESNPVQVKAVKIMLIEENQIVEYKKISGNEASDMMTEDVVVLDVRSKDEFAEGHIKNAVLLPYDEITADTASEKLPDKNKTVLLYCRTGRRSEIAAKTLIELGYTNVYDFGGITTDWTGEVVK